MITIHKYRVNIGETSISMPKGADILSAGEQHGSVLIWVEVDDANSLVERGFNVLGTGWEVPVDSAQFVDTVFVGGFVWHVYDKGEM